MHGSIQISVFGGVDIYPGVEFLHHIVVLSLVFLEISILFSTVWLQQPNSHQHCARVPLSPHPCQLLLFMFFSRRAILTQVRWHLIVRFCLFVCLFFFFGHLGAHGVPGPGIRSRLQWWPTWQLRQHQILSPLCWVRDQTCVLMLPRRGQSHGTIAETSRHCFNKSANVSAYEGGTIGIPILQTSGLERQRGLSTLIQGSEAMSEASGTWGLRLQNPFP